MVEIGMCHLNIYDYTKYHNMTIENIKVFIAVDESRTPGFKKTIGEYILGMSIPQMNNILSNDYQAHQHIH